MKTIELEKKTYYSLLSEKETEKTVSLLKNLFSQNFYIIKYIA